ncbi:MAG: hypothetical protein V1875_05845 [Candidatus Altiarchaeota archaeon]
MRKSVLAVAVVLVAAGLYFGGFLPLGSNSPEADAPAVKDANRQNAETVEIANDISSLRGGAPSSTTSSTTTTTSAASNGVGSRCRTYRDCARDLLCLDSVCAKAPAYTQFFIKVELQRMNGGSPPGPKNKPVAASTFKVGDGINVDITPKPDVTGMAYSDVNNAITGELVVISQKVKVQSAGSGHISWYFDAPQKPGKYELKIYFNDNQTNMFPFDVSG